jgi:hypothetical protein
MQIWNIAHTHKHQIMQIWNVGRIFYVLGYGYMLCVLCVCVYVCLQCASVPVRLCVFVCVCVNWFHRMLDL